VNRDEPFEGKCTYESGTYRIFAGRITFVLHTDHLECMLIIFSLLNQLKDKFSCLDEILSKKCKVGKNVL